VTGEADRRVRVIEGGGPLSSVAWSPDGSRLAIGGAKGVALWSADGRRLWQDEGQPVNNVRWSPDGQRLATAASEIFVREVSRGRVLARWEASGSVDAWTVSWSPRGDRIAWDSDEGQVCIAEVATGEITHRWNGHTGLAARVAWSSREARLASGGTDGRVRVWQAESGQRVADLEGHSGTICALGWSPDGRLLASGAADRSVRIWGPEEHSFRSLVFEGHTKIVRSICWGPDGVWLASGTQDGPILIWDPEKGTEVLRLGDSSSGAAGLDVSPDGTRLASASEDGRVRIWDVSDLARPRPALVTGKGLEGWAARQAATVGRRAVQPAPTLWVPRLPGGDESCLGVLKAGEDAAYAGSVAILAGGRRAVVGGTDGRLQCWDLESGTIAWEPREKDTSTVQDIVSSPDLTRIATTSSDDSVRIWDARSGEPLAVLSGHQGTIFRLAWSPDGKKIASSSNRDARVWDAEAGRLIELLEDQEDAGVRGVSWSPNGKWLAVSRGLRILLWSPHDGARQVTEVPSSSGIREVLWTADGSALALSGRSMTIQIWDPFQGVQLLEFSGDGESVQAMAWSPDGRLLAAGHQDGTVRIWDPQSRAVSAQFAVRGQYVWRLAWSPDGAYLASSHHGATVHFWDTRALVLVRPHRAEGDPVRGAVPLSPDLAALPAATAQVWRVGLYAPLCWLRDLLALTGGAPPEGPLGLLRENPRLHDLAELRWPPAARIGLLPLLLDELAVAETWKPPAGSAPLAVRDALAGALAGEPCEPEGAEPLPAGAVAQAAERVDERLLTLLTALGPGAVAADPGLPLRLLPRVRQMQALTAPQRHLLGMTLSPGREGTAQGHGPGTERSGVDVRGELRSLLPSQLALPRQVLAARHWRGELLYRAHTGQEPPRLRPAVLVLDVSPPVFGPVEKTTRLAAHVIASSLLHAGLPAVLLLAGGGVRWLERGEDLLEIWTARSLAEVEAGRLLAAARGLRESLAGGPLEPVIVLLTHAFFAAEEEVPAIAGLRGLFVQYPRQQVRPALAGHCERMESVAAAETDRLGEILGRLVA
jgi:WD40 repeat protein